MIQLGFESIDIYIFHNYKASDFILATRHRMVAMGYKDFGSINHAIADSKLNIPSTDL